MRVFRTLAVAAAMLAAGWQATLADEPAPDDSGTTSERAEGVETESGSEGDSAIPALVGRIIRRGFARRADRSERPQPDDRRDIRTPGEAPAEEDGAGEFDPEAAPVDPGPALREPVGSDRRSRFSQRLLQRRLAMIERMRAEAIASGDAEMEARTYQLEAFVLELHEVGLPAMAQRFLDSGLLSGDAGEPAGEEGAAEMPETDFGESAPLPGTDLGSPEEALPPPELPPPALPDEQPADAGDRSE